MSVRLFVKDNVTGEVHEYGENCHDSLIIQPNGMKAYIDIGGERKLNDRAKIVYQGGKDKIMNKQYYSVEEMGNVLGIGRTMAYHLVHSENFPSITIGKRILIPAEALERWVESKLQESKE